MVYYLHGDHLGSTSLTTNQSGVLVSQARYLPYGEERWTNDASPTDFTFTAQRSEAGFGLMDYNARYYSQVLGRFISPDSIVPDPTNSNALNRYAYVSNNPLRYTDPTGHCEENGDESCWSQYEALKRKCPNCNSLITPGGDVSLESANYGQLHASTTNGFPYAVAPGSEFDIDSWAWDNVPSVVGLHAQATGGFDFFFGIDSTPIDIARTFSENPRADFYEKKAT